ncbi:MAG: antirestriction protein ArdA [Campylobacterota bacterium]|nr:antirestriction protein ArdA [Campylobacterota bacterium]
MKIYITDLEAYNAGHLVGEWYTLPMPEDSLAECNEDVLYNGRKACGDTHHHEESFITDYEADITISEHDDIYRLNELAEAMQSYTEHDLLILKFLSHEGFNEREVIDNGVNSYDVDIYDYSSDTSFTDVYELLAYDMVADGLFGCVPSNFENYIDYSAIGRDLSMEYTEFEHGILGRVA